MGTISASSAASARSRCSPTGPIASPPASCRRAPPRPQGVERNVVITEWDWADPKAYLHDEISTDKRNPHGQRQRPDLRLARGEHRLSARARSGHQHRDQRASCRCAIRRRHRRPDNAARRRPTGATSRSGTARPTSTIRCSTSKGRVWVTSRVRPPDNPAFCKAGSDHPSAKLFPLEQLRPPARDVRSEDQEAHATSTPASARTTCMFARGRQQHAVDQRGGRRRRGRLAQHEDVRRDRRRGEVAGLDARSSSTPTATASATPTSSRTSRSIRRRTSASSRRFYGVGASPADGSIWGSVLGIPGRGRPRSIPGANPPATALAEIYELPSNDPKAVHGFSPRGMDIDRNGVVWTALASGHLASFDRRKCKGPLNGPTATGQHCPEGWTLYPFPRPAAARASPIRAAPRRATTPGSISSTRSGSARTCRSPPATPTKSLLALVDGKWVDAARAVSDGLLRQGHGRPHRRSERRLEGPRPLVDLRHPRRRSTWKAARARRSKVVQFQMRPDPLAR